jgi:hypothetical protein
MKRLIPDLPRFVTSFWNDTGGIILPYVSVMLPVIFGFALLALDAARFESLQTQMQAAADALALAGARELDKESGAQARAISAMANASFGNDNTLFGMGTTPTFTYTYTFYQSLPAANAGLTGLAATTDNNSKYVAVTVTPVTVPTIFPVPGGNKNFSTGASAIAGFAGISVCNATPLLICNPYETAGMTDAQATATLYSNLATPSQQQLFLSQAGNNAGPGHFGWVTTPDGCHSTPCEEQWIASTSGACYHSFQINLATGNRPQMEDYIDTRFDIYSGHGANQLGPSTSYAPSVNVRKGYVPGSKGNAPDWCSAYPGNGTSNVPTSTSNGNALNPSLLYTKPPPSVMVTGNASKNSATISNLSSTSGYGIGYTITGPNIPSGTMITAINTAAPPSLTISSKASGAGTGSTFTISPTWSGLPQDSAFTGFQGNGDWNCADYWSINHTVAAPAGCTSSNPSVSRYQIYRYEIANNLINDWSKNLADTQGSKNPPGNFYTEGGGPYCAAASGVSGVDTTTGGVDRRNLIVPIVNCMAQNITGGNNTQTPVAAFGTFFLTQPFAVDGTYLWGEMTGLVGSNSNVQIANQVQLYR